MPDLLRNSVPGKELSNSSGEPAALRRRVLVADDQPRMLDVIAAMVGKSFDIIGLVSDGPAALEATLKLEPDLVVLDISMPGMNGIEVARELRKRASSAKIVFLTGYEDTEIVAYCLAAGGLGYVVKQLMNSDLIHAITEALADRVFVSRFSSEPPTP
jgi:DNA-binding NarL/FixJ family response regulator